MGASLPRKELFDIPEGLSFEAAAGFPVQYLTAQNCLHEWGGLEEGESVLIHAAAGGVGTAAVTAVTAPATTASGTARNATEECRRGTGPEDVSTAERVRRHCAPGRGFGLPVWGLL